jgi:hypothetical protein
MIPLLLAKLEDDSFSFGFLDVPVLLVLVCPLLQNKYFGLTIKALILSSQMFILGQDFIF